ncbi:MAG: FapA family protein, partial [Thermodesulfobacteriota bacterium]
MDPLSQDLYTVHFQNHPVDHTTHRKNEGMELVKPDQLLVSITPSKTIAATDTPTADSPIILEAGEGTELSAHNSTVLATCYGFPLLEKNTDKGRLVIRVSITPLVRFSKNHMEARLNLHPLTETNLSLKGLKTVLHDAGVSFGLDDSLLETTYHHILSGTTTPPGGVLIARGIPAIDGKNSFLRFELEIGPIPGKLLGNGKIDFRERRMFLGVRSGQLIAVKVPATSGSPGRNVLGETITQQNGRDLKVTAADDSVYDEESGEIRAVKDGILAVINEKDIKVCSRQIIDGDIDYSTGNIESWDAIEINGSVLPLFKVQTKGNLLIKGDIRSASVTSEANLTVKGGIFGKKTRVKSGGDSDINFLEQARLSAAGNVVVRKQAYFCQIRCSGTLLCQKQCKIVGSTCIAGGNIVTGTVGSPRAPDALLAASVHPKRYKTYLQSKSKLIALEDKLTRLTRKLGQAVNSPARQKLEKKIDKLTRKLRSFNLVPETDSHSADKGVEQSRTASISIYGTVY